MATALRLVHSAPPVAPKTVVRIETAMELARAWLDALCRCGHPEGDHINGGRCESTYDPETTPCGCEEFVIAPLAIVRTDSTWNPGKAGPG